MGEWNKNLSPDICTIKNLQNMRGDKKKLKLIHNQKKIRNNKIVKVEEDLKALVEKIEKNLNLKNNQNDITKLSY